MSTPKRGKMLNVESTERSPKNFCWAEHYEDTLLDLLVREARKDNRPDSSFTAIAFRNVVKDFNQIHDTNIMKKHVQNRIKTMKHHFVLFHAALNGLSGFAWNRKTKMLEAEDDLWEQRCLENHKFEKLRDKSCHNFDKLFELYGDTRTNSDGASGLKGKKNIQRGLDFEELRIGTDDKICGDIAANECSSYGEHEFSKGNGALAGTPEYIPTQQSTSSSRSKMKRKSYIISVMEDGYKTMAASIDKLSMALSITGEKVACSKFDVNLNCQIYEVLASLGLDENNRVRCYCYLCSNPSKATILVVTPNDIREKLLVDIMKAAGYPQ